MRKSAMKRSHETNVQNQNPLFVNILTDMRDKAKEDNRRAEVFRYNKILLALRRYSKKLKTGQDCIDLKACGPKTCDLIDKKLEEYKKSGHQLNNHVTSEDEDEGSGGKRAKKNDGAESDAESGTGKSGSQSSRSDGEDDEEEAKTSEPVEARKKIKARRTKK